MNAARRRIVVTPPNFDAGTIAFLEAHHCDVDLACLAPRKAENELSESELIGLLTDAGGWIIGPAARVTRTLVAALPACRVFARRGVGYERLDIAALTEFGRVATIAAGANDPSVADHAIGLMLAVGRRMREQHLAMQAGDWSIKVSADLYRKTVGIVGLGRAGRALATRLSGFEARILATTPRPDLDFARARGIEIVDLSTLLRDSDYISLHAPLGDSTRHLIDARALAAMKPSAILVNTGRGGLVDDAALLAALRDGRIAGAGLDVFEGESDPAARDMARALLALPNVVATPHSAASTREGLERVNRVAAQCMIAALDGVAPPVGCLIADGRA